MGKIGAEHLKRRACVYVRQSSLAQVQHHRESTARQYNLQERAQVLGWPSERVEVIDDDQGKSGASAVERGGFQRLVSQVALGAVGAVFGLEASRLARSCADWYRLLEVAALTDTLIVDEEGVYDPNHYNDRLLLGLKGTLSEAELHFLKQRMLGGRWNKVRRGAYRLRLPTGYVWEAKEGIRMDPDERVRDTVNLFFRSFERIGTAAGVAREFDRIGQLFPRRDGWGGEQDPTSWGPLSISRSVQLLKSPIYAGAYAYGRRHSNEWDDEDPCAGGRILLPGSHPGYISQEQFERNQARLAANRTGTREAGSAGAVREGRALLQGIVLCGVCGRGMTVHYMAKQRPTYVCVSRISNRVCQAIHAPSVDGEVERAI
ncbi:MAG: recombinase family protein, partial [Candidatus Thermoplasmatota archaeon]